MDDGTQNERWVDSGNIPVGLLLLDKFPGCFLRDHLGGSVHLRAIRVLALFFNELRAVRVPVILRKFTNQSQRLGQLVNPISACSPP